MFHAKDIADKYNDSLKEGATLYINEGGYVSYAKIVTMLNAKYNLVGKRKLNSMTLSNYVNRDMIGTSPLKKGPKPKVPPELLDFLNWHVSMTQLTGMEEGKARTLKTMIGAVIWNTSVEG